MKDLNTRQDIKHLVDSFYKKARKDDLIGIYFTEVVQLDWDVHMPVMYDFWETTLLGSGPYRGNPMLKHIDLHRKRPLEGAHFDRWLNLWVETVRRLFEGENAENAVKRATQIAQLMKFKIAEGTR